MSIRILKAFLWLLCSLRTDATYKGFVNPLRHYNASDGSLRFVLQLADSESTEELAAAVQDFLVHFDEYKANLAQLRRGRNVGNGRCIPTLVDTQNVWPTVERIAAAGYQLTRRYVNVGAHDGHSDDPLYDYARFSNATGVAVERDAERCARHREVLPNVGVACSEVTPQNILELIHPALDGSDLDVLKVDIDSYDCPVLEMILPQVNAKIVLVEANPSIPPPYQWSMLHHPELWSFFNSFHSPEEVPIRGCSLAYEVQLLRRHGYDLVAFGGHDAVFTHESASMDKAGCQANRTREATSPEGAECLLAL
ncbi:unnamed protein product [Effrenium voratum]|nr:unnamed protein product [Effrenium voratum]